MRGAFVHQTVAGFGEPALLSCTPALPGSCQHHTSLLPLPILRRAGEAGHKFADYVHLGRLAPLMAFMTAAAASDGVLHPRLLIADGCLLMPYIPLNKSEPMVNDCRY